MKHLIFDCGGVLVYPRLGDWKLPYRMAEILGARSKDIYTSRFLLAQRQCEQWLDEAQLVPDTAEERRLRLEYIRAIDEKMEWHLSLADINTLAADFTENPRRYGFFTDVQPWLLRWKERYSLGMLSDAMPSILVFMKQQGLLDLFNAAVISTQVGAIKPDKRMYEAILNALNAAPEDCLFVDDRPCNLEGAVEMGMRAVQMARPACLPEAIWEGPVAHSFKELDGLLGQ